MASSSAWWWNLTAPHGAALLARWATSDSTIYDNKGRPVRVYKPFFSATNGFESEYEQGFFTVEVHPPCCAFPENAV